MHTVTAVIPTYNRARTIGSAIESVLAQTRPPDEIIIVDDGSTDSTPETLARFAGRIRVIRQENAGVSAARLAGARAATGRWIAHLDSDDRWREDAIERHLDALRTLGADATPAVVFADAVARTDAGLSETLFSVQGFTIDKPRLIENPADCCHPAMLPMLQTSLIDRAALLDSRAFEEGLRASEDFLLFIRLALRGPFLARPGVAAEIERTSAEQASSLSRAAGTIRADDVRARVLAFGELAAHSVRGPWRTLHAEHVRAWCMTDQCRTPWRSSLAQFRSSRSPRAIVFSALMLAGPFGRACWRALRRRAAASQSTPTSQRCPFRDRLGATTNTATTAEAAS